MVHVRYPAHTLYIPPSQNITFSNNIQSTWLHATGHCQWLPKTDHQLLMSCLLLSKGEVVLHPASPSFRTWPRVSYKQTLYSLQPPPGDQLSSSSSSFAIQKTILQSHHVLYAPSLKNTRVLISLQARLQQRIEIKIIEIPKSVLKRIQKTIIVP